MKGRDFCFLKQNILLIFWCNIIVLNQSVCSIFLDAHTMTILAAPFYHIDTTCDRPFNGYALFL